MKQLSESDIHAIENGVGVYDEFDFPEGEAGNNNENQDRNGLASPSGI